MAHQMLPIQSLGLPSSVTEGLDCQPCSMVPLLYFVQQGEQSMVEPSPMNKGVLELVGQYKPQMQSLGVPSSTGEGLDCQPCSMFPLL